MRINPHAAFMASPPWLPPEGLTLIELMAAKTRGAQMLAKAEVSHDNAQSLHMVMRILRKDHWTALCTFLGYINSLPPFTDFRNSSEPFGSNWLLATTCQRVAILNGR